MGLPPRTHCSLIPHVAMCIPPDVFLIQRFVGFYYSGTLCYNNTLSDVFNNARFYPTRLGNNVRHIFEKCGF